MERGLLNKVIFYFSFRNTSFNLNNVIFYVKNGGLGEKTYVSKLAKLSISRVLNYAPIIKCSKKELKEGKINLEIFDHILIDGEIDALVIKIDETRMQLIDKNFKLFSIFL